MWSPNSARTEGARIGREVAPLDATNEELLALVDQHVTSRYAPRSAGVQAESGSAAAAATAAVFVAVVAGVWVALATGILDELHPAFADVRAATASVPVFVPAGALALALVLVVVALIAYSRARKADATRRQIAREARNERRAEFRRAAYEGALSALRRRQKREQPAPSRPMAAPTAGSNMNPTQAEQFVAEWMRQLGDLDARATRATNDGGIDVESRRFIAQVKHYSTNVGVAPLRELAGVAAVDGRTPLFFTRTGYASGAVDFADNSGIALFVYDEARGFLRGANQRGQTYAARGLDI